MRKLQVFMNNCLHSILNIRWPAKISNKDLLKSTEQVPINRDIRSGCGYVTHWGSLRTTPLRMPCTWILKASAQEEDQRAPGTGTQQQSWWEMVLTDNNWRGIHRTGQGGDRSSVAYAPKQSYAQNKTGGIIWMVGKCGFTGGREIYVSEMQKHIPVDIYGHCGPLGIVCGNYSKLNVSCVHAILSTLEPRYNALQYTADSAITRV